MSAPVADGGPATGAAGPLVECRGLRKSFQREGGAAVNALNSVDLDVLPGEIVVLLGPSGCGKTTLLRCIAGLEEPDQGRISLKQGVVFDADRKVGVPPNRRDLNMMFQSYALWPHMTLRDNVAFPLRVRGQRNRQARRIADEYLALTGLAGLGAQYPGEVSGGQQQRAALARTLVAEPAVVLFDEPLSNVDAQVRSQLRRELLRIHAALQFAGIYVTHDQSEAMSIGNRLAVMDVGSIVQLDTPRQIYDCPANRYVAEFIGRANLLEAEVVDVEGDTAKLATAVGTLVVRRSSITAKAENDAIVGSRMLLVIRPESVKLLPTADLHVSGTNRFQATIDSTIYSGSRTEYTCVASDVELEVWDVGTAVPHQPGTKVWIEYPVEALRVVGL